MPQIARMIGVNKSTVKRRMIVYGLHARKDSSEISDQQLNSVIKDVTAKFPNCGYRRMDGLLDARGIKVAEKRLRASMQRDDPE